MLHTPLILKIQQKKIRRSVITSSLLALAFVLIPFAVRADNSILPDSSSNVECSFLPQELCKSDIMEFMNAVANFLVGIFGAIFVLMIVIAGAQLVTAGDNPERVKAAKKRLVNAVVSLVLLICFRAILYVFGIQV